MRSKAQSLNESILYMVHEESELGGELSTKFMHVLESIDSESEISIDFGRKASNLKSPSENGRINTI